MNYSPEIDPDEILEEAHGKTDMRMEEGKKIKEIREELDLSQRELAEMLGLKESDVASFEQGRVVNINTYTQLVVWAENRRPGEIY
jgi:DNA-binding transcriptional regulator YiaG